MRYEENWQFHKIEKSVALSGEFESWNILEYWENKKKNTS